MRCPFCNAEKESLKVIDSRSCEGGRSIRRRRKCVHCNKRFTTYERVETTVRLTVIKKMGERVPWDRQKIASGLERACYKRPVPDDALRQLVDEVEDEIFAAYEKEVPSSAIGKAVSDKLRRLDQVAYVRFASVYRQFKTLDDLVNEAKAVIEARNYEDVPGQGRLFLEEHKASDDGDPAERRRVIRRRGKAGKPPVQPSVPPPASSHAQTAAG